MDKRIEISKNDRSFRRIDESEPEWFYRLRRKGWDYYSKIGSPNRISNLWRYTNPAIFENGELERLEIELPKVRNGNNGNRPAENSKSSFEDFNLTPELKEKGVIFKDLFSAVRLNPGLTEKFLGKLVGFDFGRFEALNLALWNKGWFLKIPDNTTVDEPIYLNNIITEKSDFRRLLVLVGDNSRVDIIDDYSSSGDTQNTSYNCVTELFVGNGSNVKYINLQRPHSGYKGLLTYRAAIGRDSNLHSIFGGFGGTAVKVNVGVRLTGKGSESRIDGIVFAENKQHFDYHTRHHHTSSDTYSNLNFKVVLKDKSNSAYTGLIRIEEDALNCEAYQENRNLLLNKGAKAESIPELEILTDEVRCSHGATMGPIDPEMIFYLKSRGLNSIEATKAVVEGFVNSIMDRIPVKIADIFKNLVSEKLGGQTG
ncbi:MAG: Fe-S cluster assembly protein SufD [candidate division Zixibacteria bacterium]